MITGFRSIVIAVPQLASAQSEYQQLLGAFQNRDETALLHLANVGIELVEDSSLSEPRIQQLVLWSEQDDAALPADVRELPLGLSDTRDVSVEATASGVTGVDHIVLRTRDADDCIRLFNEDLGMRLALDQAVPEWGGRMLFFRCGKLTLEVIQHLEEPVDEDYFWGITYLCEDLAATLEKLDEAGVAHSELREGRKPGTVVATVKSHHLGLPTLLIQPASR